MNIRLPEESFGLSRGGILFERAELYYCIKQILYEKNIYSCTHYPMHRTFIRMLTLQQESRRTQTPREGTCPLHRKHLP